MSVVIKSGDAKTITARVRPLEALPSQPERKPADLISPEILALKRDIEALSRQSQKQVEEIAGLRAELETAHRDGELAGRRAAMSEVQTREEERLSLLRVGIDRACTDFQAIVRELERLSPLIALEGLQKIIGDPAAYSEILNRSIASGIARLESGAIVSVEVSRQDFPDEQALRAPELTVGGTDIHVLDELGAGHCRIKLRLGEIDISPGQQWDRLGDLLRTLSNPEVAP